MYYELDPGSNLCPTYCFLNTHPAARLQLPGNGPSAAAISLISSPLDARMGSYRDGFGAEFAESATREGCAGLGSLEGEVTLLASYFFATLRWGGAKWSGVEWYSAVRCVVVRCDAMWCGAVRCGTEW